jgi:hypothetical protein
MGGWTMAMDAGELRNALAIIARVLNEGERSHRRDTPT